MKNNERHVAIASLLLIGLSILFACQPLILVTPTGRGVVAWAHVAFAAYRGLAQKNDAPWIERVRDGLALGTLAIGSLLTFSLYLSPVNAHFSSAVTVILVSAVLRALSQENPPPSGPP
jgi:hypothetical protein